MRDFNVGAIIVTYNPEIKRFKNIFSADVNMNLKWRMEQKDHKLNRLL